MNPQKEQKSLDPKTPPLASWQGITELSLTGGKGTINATRPDKRQFCSLRCEGGTHTKPPMMPSGSISEEEYNLLFQQGIDNSVRLEKQDAQKAKAAPAAK
jgi:hypothetical protein